MICFTEEFEGGNQPIKEIKIFKPTEEELLSIKEHMLEKYEKEEINNIGKEDPKILYKDCTPIYKYLAIRMDQSDFIYQVKFLFGYEENDVVREDIINHAAEYLLKMAGLLAEKNGIPGFTARYSIEEEPLDNCIEIKP